MSNKKKGFFKSIFSLLKSKEQKIEEVDEKELIKNNLEKTTNSKNKIWKKECNPLRKLILWGYDDKNNPSFLILYGKHEFKENLGSEEENNYVLEDDVKYTSYALFKGKEGHLPAFQAVKIVEDYYYRSNEDNNNIKMYYKKGIKGYWRKDENYIVKEFINLKPEAQIKIPYFNDNLYSDYIRVIEETNIEFSGFKLVKDPNEILKLNDEFIEYYENICEILTNQNIYMRKKLLNHLLEMKPHKDIYNLLMKIGSTELISGLFLELAKEKNPILMEEAKIIFGSDITWGEENYIKGVKRCAHIYMTALNEETKEERIKFIYDNLPDMDLHLIKLNGNDIPKEKVIEGAHYKKYADDGVLSEYRLTYDYSNRKYIEHRKKKRYKESIYSDGVSLNGIELKNTIQEAEIYGLADVIGKIAYYLDAPRLNYYFKGNEKSKELKYYKRYVRRIIDSYGKNNPEKFMQAMKALLTSYTQYDYICKFRGNFQFNDLLKHYLYFDFKEKPPVGWENWQARHKWMENDQLMRLQGRYEFMQEIWDNHLKDVLEIASEAKIKPILKACYFILKDSSNTQSFVDKMSYGELISLSEGSYEPLSKMFKEVLYKKINTVNTFNSEMIFGLMKSKNEELHSIAKEFINRTHGAFSGDDMIKFIMLDNIDYWIDIFKDSLLCLDSIQYYNFINAIITNSDRFMKINISVSREIRDILSLSTEKIEGMQQDDKVNLISNIILEILNSAKIPDWVEEYIEEVIFQASYKDLENLLKEVNIATVNTVISKRSKQIISLLQAIQNRSIPSDSEIIGIIENGTSKIINILFVNLMENEEELKSRFQTLLIMLECDITILNNKAEEIFETIDEAKRKKLHGIIIDSPVKKVYSFGIRKLEEIYKTLIPKEFIIQMLEHTSSEVKSYISNKTDDILNNLGDVDKELFMYYVKTVLFVPNKISKSKDSLYKAIPRFAALNKDKIKEIEDILLDIAGSNIILDSERALTTLAMIRKEAV